MWRMGVPVATPVSARDLIAGTLSIFDVKNHVEEFERQLSKWGAGSVCVLVNSARTALYVALSVIKHGSPRTEVIIPAFTCPSVARAVLKAGLSPVLCDVTFRGFGLDPEALARVAGSNTLAVVTNHLFGFPSDISPVQEIARRVGAVLIEDAAQAFGARSDGRFVGTLGDVGVFSFGMSKVISTIGGGAILFNNEDVQKWLPCALPSLPCPTAWNSVAVVAKMIVLAVLAPCHHLGPIIGVWESRFRSKHEADDFRTATYGAVQAAVGMRLVRRLEELTEARKRNALYLLTGLSEIRGIRLPELTSKTESVFLRLPVVVEDLVVKAALRARLRSLGVNASEMYERKSSEALRALAECPLPCPKAEYFSERMLNLPVHTYMRTRQLADCVAAFRELVRST